MAYSWISHSANNEYRFYTAHRTDSVTTLYWCLLVTELTDGGYETDDTLPSGIAAAYHALQKRLQALEKSAC
jgi:hypothetical protein